MSSRETEFATLQYMASSFDIRSLTLVYQYRICVAWGTKSLSNNSADTDENHGPAQLAVELALVCNAEDPKKVLHHPKNNTKAYTKARGERSNSNIRSSLSIQVSMVMDDKKMTEVFDSLS